MSASKPTILIVSDEPLAREQFTRQLENSYRILHAADGIDAVRQFETHGECVAAVVTDLLVPRLGGGSLAGWLHHINPHLPVIILTSGVGDAELGALLQDPHVQLVTKPFNTRKLKRLLEERIDTSREA